jgi:hypothetical protein
MMILRMMWSSGHDRWANQGQAGPLEFGADGVQFVRPNAAYHQLARIRPANQLPANANKTKSNIGRDREA